MKPGAPNHNMENSSSNYRYPNNKSPVLQEKNIL